MYYSNPLADDMLLAIMDTHGSTDVDKLWDTRCGDCGHSYGIHSNYEEGQCVAFRVQCTCPRFNWPDEESTNPLVDGWW